MNFNTIPVTYDNRMVADANSYSPSARKVVSVVSDWAAKALPISIAHVAPVRRPVISAAHDQSYVNGVLDLEIDNGFGNRSGSVASALPYMVGSMVSAAELVLTMNNGPRVACSPSSGFHHAHFSRGAGFCTFNGLVITAMAMKRLGLAKRVAIIDCDFHYGDGTQEIIDTLNLGWIKHWSAGEHYKAQPLASKFMRELPLHVKYTVEDADLVLYQAGADQHMHDPLGGLLTMDEMAQRDRDVFYVCREYGKPLVWNLAGGYQRDTSGGIGPVIELHRQTMEQCVDIYLRHGDRKP